jgi:hypothetical protein
VIIWKQVFVQSVGAGLIKPTIMLKTTALEEKFGGRAKPSPHSNSHQKHQQVCRFIVMAAEDG